MLLLLAIILPAAARGTKTQITLSDVRAEVVGESLNLHILITASQLDLKCDGQTKLEFAIEDAERKLILPVVIYSGTTRYYYERRREELSGAYHVEPYHIYKGVKKNKTYQLEYKLTLPYYVWMEHAATTYSEFAHDCSGDYLLSSGVLIDDLNPTPIATELEEWKPKAELFPNLVSFLVPQVEDVKTRSSMLELNIGFPVNVTEVRPEFNNNRHELHRADSLVQALQSNDLLLINGVSIRGYASPEGRYVVNEKLARGRSEGFKKYLTQNYPDNLYIRNAHTSWVPEDWEGFGKLVEASQTISAKQEVLAIVYDNNIAPDAKDRMLQNIVWWSANYKVILKEMYPKLRRIELRVNYTVQKLDDSKARELLYTQPELLSLHEIYRVAKFYEPGSKQYREVYEIAARQYPNDVIANNNAAAALLQEGNTAAALPYLEKTRNEATSLINYGAYHYILGDKEKAANYFEKAREAGIEQAAHNLRLIE